MNIDINHIIFSHVVTPDEIDVLLNKESVIDDLVYKYDQGTINFLKRNWSRPDSFYLIAKKGDDFVAFVSADTEWSEDNHLFIREIFVSPNFQKLGIGKILLERCLEHARNIGVKAVFTETAFKNIPMQKSCERLGFKKWDNPDWKAGLTYKFLFNN